MTNQTLPTPGSVWGVPDQPDTWRYVYLVDGLNVRSRSIVTGRVSEEHVAIWESRNREVGNVDITTMLTGAVTRTDSAGRDVTHLPGLWSEEDTVCEPVADDKFARLIAWLKDPNRKPPVIAFTSGPERQIADLVWMPLHDAAKYEAELAACADIVQKRHPIGEVKAIGLLEVADGLRQIMSHEASPESARNSMRVELMLEQAQCDASLNEPHTVEWLVAIGGHQFANGIVFFISPNDSEFDYWQYKNQWTLDGQVLRTPITTKRDVLKWLNALGIVPATVKPT